MKKPKVKKVPILFDERHLPIIQRALECFTRLRAGQITYALDEVYADKQLQNGKSVINYDDNEEIQNCIRKIYFPELQSPGAAYGIGKYGYGGEPAYEISKTIRQYLAYTRNDGYCGDGVDFHGPLKYSDIPLPEITGFTTKKFFKAPKHLQEKLTKLFDSTRPHEAYLLIKEKWKNLPEGSVYQIKKEDGRIGILITEPRKPKKHEP